MQRIVKKESPRANELGFTYGRQCIDEDDVRAVLDVLRSDWLTQGPVVDKFEADLSSCLGTSHAVTCSNGTAALHLAALCLGWKTGDIVIVPAITFLASANCAVYVGAEPFFVDIEDQSLTIDPNEVERYVRCLREAGRRVRAVVGVDMAGHPCDWRALRALADRYDLQLVDDACHAMGATYDGGERIGSGRDSDVTVLSFHPVKHITTGEGGAVLTNDGGRADHIRRLRNHGTVRGETKIAGWEGPWHSDMVELGYNYRLSDLQCALGISQLRKLNRFVERRRAIAAQYSALLADAGLIRTPTEAPGTQHAYHLFLARVAFGEGRVSRREFFERCRERRLILQVHYRPVPFNSYYRGSELNRDVERRIPVSLSYYRQTVSLPIYPQLTDDEVRYVVDVMLGAL